MADVTLAPVTGPAPALSLNAAQRETRADGAATVRPQTRDAVEAPAVVVTLSADCEDCEEKGSGPDDLTEDEEAQVRDLKQRDREVRAHEQAHAIAGGPHAGAPQYQTVTGPDGREYAVAGEVAIDVSPEDEPEETIAKMEIVIRAALAPADPSSQDMAVARQAQKQRADAQAELRASRVEEAAARRDEGAGEAAPIASAASARHAEAAAAYRRADATIAAATATASA